MKALLSSSDGSRLIAIVEVGVYAESCFHRRGGYEFDVARDPNYTPYQGGAPALGPGIERILILGSFTYHLENQFLLTVRAYNEKHSAILEAYYEQFSHGLGLDPKESDRLVFAFLRALKS
jgi:hypothetical protein